MKPTILLSLALCMAPAATAQQMTFSARQLPAGFDAPRYTLGLFAGTPTMEPISADFLGNGRRQWYQGGNVISRFPESGTITLPAITLAATPSATVRGLTGAACDVDRDGDMDLVRIHRWNGAGGTYTLQVFLNSGSGTFTTGYRVDWVNNPAYDEGAPFFSVITGDFNGDGAPDLAIKEAFENYNPDTNPIRHDGRIYLRWNDGTGGFAASSNLQQNGITYYCDLAAADYDRDGGLDLYASAYVVYAVNNGDSTGRSLLFTNDGTGSFATGGNFPGFKPGGFMDVNGDGWADLTGAGRSGDVMYFESVLNDGNGSLDGVLTRIEGGLATNRIAGRMTDFTGDGLVDLVVVNDTELLTIYKNTGTALENLSQFSFLTSGVSDVDGLGTGDVDGDGDVDILLSRENGTFLYLENTTLHHMPGATLAGSASVSGVTQLHSGDFDRDGRDDVVAVMPSQERMNVLFTLDTGLPSVPLAKSTQSEAPHSAAVADFDQDGRLDIAYTLPATGEVRLIRSTAGFVLQWPDTVIANGIPGVSLLAAGEYGTPNGRPDLFAASATTGQIRGLYQSGTSWLGQNIAASLTPVPQSIAAGQFNGSPGDEVVHLSSGASSLTLRATHLSGGWTALGGTGRTETVTGGPHTAKVVWADVTGDARNDAVYINSTGGLSFWNLSNSPATSGTLGTSPSAIKDIVAVDWNRDGLTDILAATADGLTLFHELRSTRQRLRSDLAARANGYTALAIGDFNNDGAPDAAAAASTRIDYYFNAPHGLRADLSALPVQVIVPSETMTTVMNLPLATNGRFAENGGAPDGNLHVTGATVQFHEAVAGPGGRWVPGAVLTAANQPAYRVEINGPAGTACSDDNISFGANGTQSLQRDNNTDPLSPIAPGAGTAHTLRIGLFTIDSSQPYTRFFVTITSVTAKEARDDGTLVGAELTTLLQDSSPVLITRVPIHLWEWRYIYFGTSLSQGTAANDADPDTDGVPNLVEYLTGTNPTVSEPALNHARALTVLPISSPQSAIRLRVVMENRALADPSVKVALQSGPFTTGTWPTYASRIGNTTWIGATPMAIPSDNGTTTTFLFTTPFIPAADPRFFFRLKAEHTP